MSAPDPYYNRRQEKAVAALTKQILDMEAKIRKLSSGSRASQLPFSSIDNGNLIVRENGVVRQVIGRQNDGTYTTVEANGPVPPTPTLPTLVAFEGGFTLRWDGTFEDGAVAPSDFLRVDVHIEQTSGFTPTQDTCDGAIVVPSGANLRIVTNDIVPHFVKLVTVSRSGVTSEATMEVSVTPIEPPPGFELEPGMIGAIYLENGSVTPDKTSVGQTGNLIPDPSWASASYRSIRDTLFPVEWSFVPDSGTGQLLRCGPATNSSAFPLALPGVPVLPSEQYLLSVSWRRDSAGANGTVAVGVNFYKADGTQITHSETIESAVNVSTLSTSVFSTRTGTVTVPAEAAAMTMYLFRDGTTGAVLFDTVELRSVVMAPSVGSVYPNVITDGTVDSTWLQRGSFVTDTVGVRSGFDQSGFFSYDAADRLIFSTAGGNGYFAGDFQVGADEQPRWEFDQAATLIRGYPKAGDNGLFIAQDLNYRAAGFEEPETAEYVFQSHKDYLAKGGFWNLDQDGFSAGIRDATQLIRRYMGGLVNVGPVGGSLEAYPAYAYAAPGDATYVALSWNQSGISATVEATDGSTYSNWDLDEARFMVYARGGPSNSFGVFPDCVAFNPSTPVTGLFGPGSSARFGADGTGGGLFTFGFQWAANSFQIYRHDTGQVVKTFIIDHPVDKNKYLIHGATESPHNGVEYWGEATIQNNRCEVTLPDYFEALCSPDNRNVQVSVRLPSTESAKVIKHDGVLDDSHAEWVETDEDVDETPAERAMRIRHGQKRAKKKVKVPYVAPEVVMDDMAMLCNAAASTPKNGKFRIVCNGPDGTRVNWLVKAVRKDVAPLLVEPKKDEIEIHGEGAYRYYTLPKVKP